MKNGETMIEVGDLVIIKESERGYSTAINREIIGKLAVVVIKGTWSADVHIVGSKSNCEPRIALEHLEKL